MVTHPQSSHAALPMVGRHPLYSEPGQRNCRKEKDFMSKADQGREVLKKLVAWDAKYPRGGYHIVEYGRVRQCEQELDAICEAAKNAVSSPERRTP